MDKKGAPDQDAGRDGGYRQHDMGTVTGMKNSAGDKDGTGESEGRRVTRNDYGDYSRRGNGWLGGPPSLSPCRPHLAEVAPADPGLSPAHPTQHQLCPCLHWPHKYSLWLRVWSCIKNGPSPQPGIVRVNYCTCLCGYLYICSPTQCIYV